VQLRVPIALLALGLAAGARAQASGQVVAYTTGFYEFGGGQLYNVIVDPSVRARVDPSPDVTVRAGWDADIVSGASVAVVDAPSAEVDAISTATQYDDFRNVFSGGVELRSQYGTLRGSYAYGFESDYRSHSFTIGGRAEMFERNTAFDISYGRGFDTVCNLAQPDGQEAVERQALDGSEGCFDDDAPDRMTLDIDLHTFQGSWTQAWAPIFTTQVTVTAQIIDGFQSNPYRSVWLGRAAAQENHPRERTRYAAGLAARLWLEPLHGALHLNGRVYRDTWDVRSITAGLAYEQSFGRGLRFKVRGRYYRQGAAAFFSDDYAVRPRGQYFTGDRELSDQETFLVGGQFVWTLTPSSEGASLGPFSQFRLLLKADWMHHEFPSFNYGAVGVPNRDALIGTLGLEFQF
jgi:hypothetical protein